MPSKKQIYLDNAATTLTAPEVVKAMLPYFTEKYGNAESLHDKGSEALKAIDEAREITAKILNCRPSEIIFCGSATEANNLAILGAARANKSKGTHLITSKVEHPSVLEPFRQLEKEGFTVTYLDVDNEGFVNPDALKNALTAKTTLISIMYANNEIGTIEPIKELGNVLKDHPAYFHTDACQAAGVDSLDTNELNLDMMTINSSKIYGPKGVGMLFIKRETKIQPIQFGGGHEKGLRSGTQNTPGIVGFAKALQMAQDHKEKENLRLTKLRDKLIDAISEQLPECYLNGPRQNRLPNNINFTIPGIHGQEIALHLNTKGIFISTGSACKIGEEKPSEVLTAINLKKPHRYCTIRITLGKYTAEEDIIYTTKTLADTIKTLKNR